MAARHGSGRTSAACIGVLSRLKLSEGTCQALILTPSREEGELAQVVLSTVGDGTSATSHACGSDSKADLQALEQGAQVVLGTPAHVKDLLKQHALQPRSVKVRTAGAARGPGHFPLHSICAGGPGNAQGLSSCCAGEDGSDGGR